MQFYMYGKDHRCDELPEELAFREARLKKIRETKKALEEEAREVARSKAKVQEEPVFGQPLKPQADPVEPMVSDKAQRNFTDPESRIMMVVFEYTSQYYSPSAWGLLNYGHCIFHINTDT